MSQEILIPPSLKPTNPDVLSTELMTIYNMEKHTDPRVKKLQPSEANAREPI